MQLSVDGLKEELSNRGISTDLTGEQELKDLLRQVLNYQELMVGMTVTNLRLELSQKGISYISTKDYDYMLHRIQNIKS